MSVNKTFFVTVFSTVPVRQWEQEANCGGRELVRAVSLGDVNMAMLSWHRT